MKTNIHIFFIQNLLDVDYSDFATHTFFWVHLSSQRTFIEQLTLCIKQFLETSPVCSHCQLHHAFQLSQVHLYVSLSRTKLISRPGWGNTTRSFDRFQGYTKLKVQTQHFIDDLRRKKMFAEFGMAAHPRPETWYNITLHRTVNKARCPLSVGGRL